MDLDRRRLGHPEQRVPVEVGLPNPAAGHVYLAVERRAQPVEHPALHLCFGAAQVHHLTTVNRSHDSVHPDPALRVARDLDDVRGITPEGEVSRDSTRPARRQRP